jgi:hypothetical protein
MPDSVTNGAVVGATAQGSTVASGAPIGASAGGPAADWATEVTERVISGVDKLKGRTTRPVVTALRAIVYGIVVLVALLAALIFAVIGVVRIWDAYLPLSPLGRRVWIGYVAIGAVLFLSGAVLLARRRGKSS